MPTPPDDPPVSSRRQYFFVALLAAAAYWLTDRHTAKLRARSAEDRRTVGGVTAATAPFFLASGVPLQEDSCVE